MTPREASLALEGAAEGEERRMRGLQAVAYSLAVLIGPAVNNPRKMPRFDRVFPDRRRKAARQTPEAMLHSMKAWTAHMQAVPNAVPTVVGPVPDDAPPPPAQEAPE